MPKTSQDATVDLINGINGCTIDYLFFLTEKVHKTPPWAWPIEVQCTDRNMVINAIPELEVLEFEGKIKIEQIGEY